ncbi:unnamed protein product [Triticum turgidum subsp. durum]|uniref:HP domain-containing protein n=1 Tax=Triticum turgidum subsp. durum TaxID=4567 RepID=A0A9R0VXT4_TRITD|nr:unnamed protein product [Triticum turgidum subsp. durum]
MTSLCLLGAPPEKNMAELGDGLENPWRELKGKHMVNRDRSEHKFGPQEVQYLIQSERREEAKAVMAELCIENLKVISFCWGCKLAGCFIINFALETDSREFISEETFTYVWNAFRGKLHFFSLEVFALLFMEKSGPKGSGDGGPTQRASALAALSSAFNPSSQDKQSTDRPQSSGDGGPTQRASALAALSSALNTSGKPKSPQSQSRAGQGSQRAAAVSALSNVLAAESPRIDAEGEAAGSSEFDMVDEGERTEPDVSREETANENGGETVFSYDRLISKSTDPVRGIDYKRRETYLSDSEFQTVFGMSKEEFYKQPRWKQEQQKRKADLF